MSPWGMSRSPPSSELSFSPPTHTHCRQKAIQCVQAFASFFFLMCFVVGKLKVLPVGFLSLNRLKLVSLFVCLSVFLAHQYRDRKTMNALGPSIPPPPAFSSVSQRTDWREEIYRKAAMLMMI